MNVRLADRYQVGRAFPCRRCRARSPADRRAGPEHQRAGRLQSWLEAGRCAGRRAPALLATYEAERRPIATHVLGLSTNLLRAARERGEMRRGRDTQELDIGYLDSPLALDLRGTLRTHSGGAARARCSLSRRRRSGRTPFRSVPRSSLDVAGLRRRPACSRPSAWRAGHPFGRQARRHRRCAWACPRRLRSVAGRWRVGPTRRLHWRHLHRRPGH